MFRTLAITLISALSLSAEVRVSPLFSDHMVLQRRMSIPIWGTADPGEKIVVQLAAQKASVAAAADGRWRVELPPMEAGGPYALTISGTNRVKIDDVLIGEVWLASGQSNMGLPVSRALNPEVEIANANYPQLRFFSVATRTSLEPVDQIAGKWTVCSPQTAGAYSATAYFFARELVRDLNVPVGILQSAVGGTLAEPWTSREALDKDPELRAAAQNQIAALRALPAAKEKYLSDLAAWETKYHVKDPAGPGLILDEGPWKPVTLPATAASLGLHSGAAIWLRREIEIPDPSLSKTYAINFGPMHEMDTAYFNGVQIGTSGPDPLRSSSSYRLYNIPSNLVKAGRNAIAIRVFFHTAERGVFGSPRTMYFVGRQTSFISGDWQYRVEFQAPEVDRAAVDSLPHVPKTTADAVSTTLYNAMIAPLCPYGLKGVIWYQGESNIGKPELYRRIFPLLIEGWRSAWKRDFPFYFVQLPNADAPVPEPGESGWAGIRDAQLFTLKTVPNTGMAVTIELGEENDHHGRNKQDVGKRLAAVALAKSYGRKVEYTGPLYDSMSLEGGAIRLRFSSTGGGLTAKGGPLKRFAIAGDDRKFVWADARIEGNTIVVSSPSVRAPMAVRYAWADNPSGCNLYGANGLPASPFRTDDWSIRLENNLRADLHVSAPRVAPRD